MTAFPLFHKVAKQHNQTMQLLHNNYEIKQCEDHTNSQYLVLIIYTNVINLRYYQDWHMFL